MILAAFIILTVIIFAQFAVIYSLINRLLLQASVPVLQPVAVTPKRKEEEPKEQKKVLFTVPIQG